VVPKIGPFSGLAFHPPTPAVEQLFMSSFNETLNLYRSLLLAQEEGRLRLTNENLDTGALTGAGTYRLADETYAKLVDKTTGKPVSEALRRDLLFYYADLEKPFATKRNSKAWHELMKELNTLKSTPAVGIALPTESTSVSASLSQESQRGPAKARDAETDHEPKFQKMQRFNPDKSWTPVHEGSDRPMFEPACSFERGRNGIDTARSCTGQELTRGD